MQERCIWYRLPNKKEIYYISHQPQQPVQLKMVSFDTQATITFCASEAKKYTLEEYKTLKKDIPHLTKKPLQETTLEQYSNSLSSLLVDMEEEQVAKVVFSRKKIIKKEINPFQVLTNLMEQNPNAFCYWMYDKIEGSWIGATPELLLSREQNTYTTMSLAGTLPSNETWTSKEEEEQQLVTQYIVDNMSRIGVEVKVSETEELQHKNFKHLVTHITLHTANHSLEELVEKLHPTPAICGIPLQKSKHLIAKHENHNREFYTGYILLQDKAYVNLRCAKLYRNGIEVFIGGGILTTSNIQQEWKETHLKAQVIENAL